MQKQKIVALCVSTMSAISLAGPLSPPAGPVAPTAGPEPRTAINATNTPGDAGSSFVITQPGSYYLQGNVGGEANKNGIRIAASNVTIDLNGFALIGVASSVNGVVSDNNAANISIRNGITTRWGANGVFLRDSGRVEGVISDQNAASGFLLVGPNVLVTGCVATGNTGSGLDSTCCVTIVGSHFGSNSQTGISGSTSLTITDCTVTDNDTHGIVLSGSSVIRGCTVSFNRNDGIRVSFQSLIESNTLSSNGSGGDGANIFVPAAGAGNRIEGNNCTNADRGVDIDGTANIVMRNTCRGNTQNYAIAMNNVCGPVVDRTSPGSAAITGNSGAGSLISTDPNANFAY